ncbi:MAG TPA: hypothetical protein VNA28_14855 [Solirubrobacteraceae bacterium]|nr:hypothetical protein [Solirubrobacteraceae bacterium]
MNTAGDAPGPTAAERMAFGTLLQEGTLWLAVLRHDLPDGWTQQTLRYHEGLLANLREVYAHRSMDAYMCAAGHGWLIGYCMSMRSQHEGASASDMLRRRRMSQQSPAAEHRMQPQVAHAV